MSKPKAKAVAIGKATIHALQLGAQVAEERAAQIEKWGVQRHPWVRRFGYGAHYEVLAEFYKAECQRADRDGKDTWDLILLEEVHEALEELEKGNLAEARTELIQAMAIAAAIVQHIDEETGQ